MKCAWENCSAESTSLADHIYYVHLECLPKDSGRFSCKWRNCKHGTVFQYRSLLSLHLRSHLKELIRKRDAPCAAGNLIFPTIKKEATQETETKTEMESKHKKQCGRETAARKTSSRSQNDSEVDSDDNDSDEATDANLSDNDSSEEIICIDGEKLSCPVESCDSVSNEINLHKRIFFSNR